MATSAEKDGVVYSDFSEFFKKGNDVLVSLPLLKCIDGSLDNEDTNFLIYDTRNKLYNYSRTVSRSCSENPSLIKDYLDQWREATKDHLLGLLSHGPSYFGMDKCGNVVVKIKDGFEVDLTSIYKLINTVHVSESDPKCKEYHRDVNTLKYQTLSIIAYCFPDHDSQFLIMMVNYKPIKEQMDNNVDELIDVTGSLLDGMGFDGIEETLNGMKGSIKSSIPDNMDISGGGNISSFITKIFSNKELIQSLTNLKKR